MMRPRVLSESVLPPGQRLVISGEVLTVHPSSSADGSWVRGLIQRADGVRIPFVGSPHLRIRPGCEVRLSGVREDPPEHGTQIRIVDCLELKLPQTDVGVVTYLAENLAGCGRARARRILQAMGRGCIEQILENPKCLVTLFPGRIGAQMALAAEALGRAVEADRAALDLAVRLHSAGVTPGMVRRVLSYFRTPEAAEIVLLRRPYRLLEVPDIGWKRADRIARQIGVPADAQERLVAAIGAALDAAMKEGHSALPTDALLRAAGELVGGRISKPALDGALVEAEESALVINDGHLFYRPSGLEAESTIADQLRRFMMTGRSLSASERAQVEPVIAAAGLVREQEEAIWRALGSGVSVLTGGPGTGKTTTTRTFIRCCLALGWDVRIAAPTGKAASRASEVTKVVAETIHPGSCT